jgi:hypothetical protein
MKTAVNTALQHPGQRSNFSFMYHAGMTASAKSVKLDKRKT